MNEQETKDLITKTIEEYNKGPAFSNRLVSDTPTDDLQVANKKYVDDEIAGIDLSTITLDATPNADLGYNGMVIQLVANENQAIGDVCYINSDGEAQIGDASAIASSRIVVMATTTILANATGTYLIKGIIRNDAWNWTVGGPIYLTITGTTGNTLSQTPPADPLESIVLLGYATHADRLYFNPQEEKDTIDVQVFTSDGTWTKPATPSKSQPNRVFVEMWGAGGGGGGADGGAVGSSRAGGGGGGNYVCGWFDPDTLDATEAVVVGTGGAGGVGASANGDIGEDSTFKTMTAYGGGGGGGAGDNESSDGGGGGGALLAGVSANTTTAGAGGSPAGGAAGSGGDGGDSSFGGGGGGDGSSGYRGGATGYGGGGGGGGNTGTGGAGGASVYGGGGGGGGGTTGGAGGASINLTGTQGNGGAGATGTNNGNAGVAPGGGGGGAFSAQSGASKNGGAGARGEIRVYSFF